MEDIKKDHFYVGDIVELIENIGQYNAGERGTIIRVEDIHYNVIPYSPMRGEANYLHVQLDNFDGVVRVWFPHRVKLVHRKGEEAVAIPAEPPVIDIAPIVEQAIMPQEFEGFQVGDKVFCKNANHPKLVKDYPYTVAQVYANNLIRLVGIPSLWSTRRFTVFKREVAPVPMQKPIVKELSLNEQLAKKKLDGLCNFAIEFKTHGRQFYTGSPCHANLGFPYLERLREDIVLAVACNVSRDYTVSKHKKEYVEFITYIIQESPWSQCFIQRPIEDVLKDGIELDVSKNTDMVVAAAIALRLPHEYSSKLPLFSEALKLGFSKTVAFLSFQFGGIEGERVVTTLHAGGHNVVSSLFGVEGLIKFFEHGYVVENEKPYSLNHTDYSILSNICKPANKNDATVSAVIKKSRFINISKQEWGAFLAYYNGNTRTECVANMGNCFVSLGFK